MQLEAVNKTNHSANSKQVPILCRTVLGIESADMQARKQVARLVCKVLQGKLQMPVDALIRLASRIEQRIRRDSQESTL